MNIFKYEIKHYFLPTLITLILACLLGSAFLSFYPIFLKDIEGFIALIANYPPEMLAFLQFNPSDLATIFGLYGLVIHFQLIVSGTFACWLGCDLVAKEDYSRTWDFLLTKPLARRTIFGAKVFVLFLYLLIYNAILAALLFYVAGYYNPQPCDLLVFTKIHLGFTLIILVFASFGVLLGVCLRRIKSVLGVAISFVGANFVLSYLGEIIDQPWIAYFLLFTYFPVMDIATNKDLEIAYPIIVLSIIILTLLSAALIYCRRDIKAN